MTREIYFKIAVIGFISAFCGSLLGCFVYDIIASWATT